MDMRAILLALSFFLFAPVLDAQETSRSSRPTVAVIDFQMGTTLKKWWEDGMDVGKGIADMLLEELLQSGSLRLLERSQMDAVMKEQDMANSGRSEESASDIVQTGKIVGARYFITGSVTKFGAEDRNLGIGGLAGALTGRSYLAFADVATRKTTAQVEISARVIDTTTGEIVAAVRSAGKSKRSGLLLGGIGASGSKVAGGQVQIGSSNFRETILGEATSVAVQDAAIKLIAAINGSSSD